MARALVVEERYWIVSGSEVKLNEILLPSATSAAEVPFSKLSVLEQETVVVPFRCVTERIRKKLPLKTSMCFQTDKV